uniref:Voltage-dependent calcium channel unc-36 (projected from Caenorhabditis elegans ortholog unc-36) n=1 Tax=Strongyloides venezuelensis TaxID=75913 RepID=A0A0K0EXV0_STRVS
MKTNLYKYYFSILLFFILQYIYLINGTPSASSVSNWSIQLKNTLHKLIVDIGQPDKIIERYQKISESKIFDPRVELKKIKKEIEKYMGHRAKLAWQAKSSLQAKSLPQLNSTRVNDPQDSQFIRYMNAKLDSDGTVVYKDGAERVAIHINSTRRFQYHVNANFYGQKTSFEASAVHFPTPVYNREPELLMQVQWSDIDQFYQKNKERVKDLFFQSFCSESGFLRYFPASPWKFDNEPSRLDLFDCRNTEWFLASATMPKSIVIMLDLSGSMLGQRFEIAKQTVETILETLSDNDYFNIIPFSKTANLLGTCDDENLLLQATLRNKKILRSKLSAVVSEGKADYEVALAKAFSTILNLTSELTWKTKEEYEKELLLGKNGNASLREKCFTLEDHVVCGDPAYFEHITNINTESKNKNIGCNNAIMLITDGAPGYYKEIFELYNKDRRVRFFSFLIGEEAVDFDQVKWMACINRGFMVHINNMADVHEKVQHYIKVMSRSVGYIASEIKEDDAIWSGIQLERISNKFVTTVGYPVILNEDVMGVSSVSIPLTELNQFATPSMIGARSHFFMLDNNGYVVIHPQLTPFEPETNKLKSGYNNMDLVEIEVLSQDKIDLSWLHNSDPYSPVCPTGALYDFCWEHRLKEDETHIFTCDNTETPTWSVLYAVENMKRVYPQVNKYYTECIDNTEFIIGFAIGDGDEKRLERREKKIDYSKVDLSWFDSTKFIIHPEWRYCLLNDSDYDITPEEALKSYASEMRRSGKLPELCKSREYLVNQVLLDAQATKDLKEVWQQKWAEHLEDRINLVFLATPSGLTRYYDENVETFKYLSDIDNSTEGENYPYKHFIRDHHKKSTEEEWYKRAVRMKGRIVIDINPLYQIPYDGPKETAYRMYENSTILAHAYKAIYLDGVVLGVLGIEFDYDYIVGTMDKIGCGPNTKNNWCFLLDEHGYVIYSSKKGTTFSAYLTPGSLDPRNKDNVLGKWFGKVNRVTEATMKKLTDPKYNYYSISKFVDYQAVCIRDKPVVAHASLLPISPLKNFISIVTWFVRSIVKLAKTFNLPFILSIFEAAKANAYTPSFQKTENNSYACEKESPFFIANFDKKHDTYPSLNEKNTYDRPCTNHGNCAIKLYASWVQDTNLLLVSIVNTPESNCYDETQCAIHDEKDLQFEFKIKTDPGDLGVTTPPPTSTTENDGGIKPKKIDIIASNLNNILSAKTTPMPNLALSTPIDKKFFKCKKSPSKRRMKAIETCGAFNVSFFKEAQPCSGGLNVPVYGSNLIIIMFSCWILILFYW